MLNSLPHTDNISAHNQVDDDEEDLDDETQNARNRKQAQIDAPTLGMTNASHANANFESYSNGYESEDADADHEPFHSNANGNESNMAHENEFAMDDETGINTFNDTNEENEDEEEEDAADDEFTKDLKYGCYFFKLVYVFSSHPVPIRNI